MKAAVFLLSALLAPGVAVAQSHGAISQEQPYRVPPALMLPSESRSLPIEQRLGRFHSGLVSCEISASLQIASLREDAKMRMPAGQAGQFDWEYSVGYQVV